jgi:hypothetical protein
MVLESENVDITYLFKLVNERDLMYKLNSYIYPIPAIYDHLQKMKVVMRNSYINSSEEFIKDSCKRGKLTHLVVSPHFYEVLVNEVLNNRTFYEATIKFIRGNKIQKLEIFGIEILYSSELDESSIEDKFIIDLMERHAGDNVVLGLDMSQPTFDKNCVLLGLL